MKGAFPCFSRIPGKMGMLLVGGNEFSNTL